MDYSKESLDRIKKIEDLKNLGVVCYANNFKGKQDIKDIKEKKGNLAKSDELMKNGAIGKIKTAGRIMSSRGMGKLLFGKLRDCSGSIQLCFMKDKVEFNTGVENKHIFSSLNRDTQGTPVLLNLDNPFKIAEKFCQVGDYIGIIGDLFETKHSELTIFVKEFQILSKAVRPLPEKFHGLQNKETIYRQRYLDLIMNDDSYNRFNFRSKFIKTIREFYRENNFTEIETPVLGNSASGAAAKPFVAYHKDFEENFFLRIAPEIALKKATCGRFERVFEIGKNFRNEGSDPSHMQEFTSAEHYACWWNFEDNMEFTQKMFDYIFDKMKIQKKIKIKDKDGKEKIVNFTTPWKKIDYIKAVKEKSQIDVSSYNIKDMKKLRDDIKSAGYSWDGINNQGVTTMIDYLYKKVLRPSIVGPAFVYNYPKTMQPLARESDSLKNIVEQFQLVLNGWEVVKSYSELVDPKIQKENFIHQLGAINSGDEEATSGDDDFVLAMEYAMPPQSGWGMGVDRMVSLLTKQENLRDVVLFPLVKEDLEK